METTMESNKWFIYGGDIILQSEDQEQLEFANAWIVALREAIREQLMEELNGGNELSNGYEQPELPEDIV
jgi:hypothetical protein